jgi:hypothetical protein
MPGQSDRFRDGLRPREPPFALKTARPKAKECQQAFVRQRMPPGRRPAAGRSPPPSAATTATMHGAPPAQSTASLKSAPDRCCYPMLRSFKDPCLSSCRFHPSSFPPPPAQPNLPKPVRTRIPTLAQHGRRPLFSSNLRYAMLSTGSPLLRVPPFPFRMSPPSRSAACPSKSPRRTRTRLAEALREGGKHTGLHVPAQPTLPNPPCFTPF